MPGSASHEIPADIIADLFGDPKRREQYHKDVLRLRAMVERLEAEQKAQLRLEFSDTSGAGWPD